MILAHFKNHLCCWLTFGMFSVLDTCKQWSNGHHCLCPVVHSAQISIGIIIRCLIAGWSSLLPSKFTRWEQTLFQRNCTNYYSHHQDIAIFLWVHFWTLYSVFLFVFFQIQHFVNYSSFKVSCNTWYSKSIKLPLKDYLAYSWHWYFQIHFGIYLPIYKHTHMYTHSLLKFD